LEKKPKQSPEKRSKARGAFILCFYKVGDDTESQGKIVRDETICIAIIDEMIRADKRRQISKEARPSCFPSVFIIVKRDVTDEW